MSKNKFFTLCITASIILTTFLFSLTIPVNADTVFIADYESGDFSDWTSTKNNGVNLLYHREYIQFSALPPVGAECDLFGIMNIHRTIHLGTVSIANDGADYQWVLHYYDNGVSYSVSTNAVDLKKKNHHV